MKKIFLIIFILCLVQSNSAFAQDESYQELLIAKTLKCSFSLGMTVDWDNGVLDHKVVGSKMEFFFATIDLKKNTATMVGNAGSEEVSVIANGKGLTFHEQTPSGNLNFTTVFYYYIQSLSGFATVHSRHMDVLGAPKPSQYYGGLQDLELIK